MRRVLNVTNVLCSLLFSFLFTTPVPPVKAGLLDGGLDVLCLIAEFAEWKPRCRLSRMCVATRIACNVADCRRFEMYSDTDPNNVQQDWITPFVRCESERFRFECIDAVTNWMIGSNVFCESHWFSAARPTREVPQIVCEFGPAIKVAYFEPEFDVTTQGKWICYVGGNRSGIMLNLESRRFADFDTEDAPRMVNDNLAVIRNWVTFELISLDDSGSMQQVLNEVVVYSHSDDEIEEIKDLKYWTIVRDQCANVKISLEIQITEIESVILMVDLSEKELLSEIYKTKDEGRFRITQDGTSVIHYIPEKEKEENERGSNMKWLWSTDILTGIQTRICPVMGSYSQIGHINRGNEYYLEQIENDDANNQQVHFLLYHLSLKALVGKVNICDCNSESFVGWIDDDMFVLRGKINESDDESEYLLFSVHQPQSHLQIVSDLFQHYLPPGMDEQLIVINTDSSFNYIAMLQCKAVINADEPTD